MQALAKVRLLGSGEVTLQNLYEVLEALLRSDAALTDEHRKLNKNVLLTRAANLDEGFLARLMSSELIRREFFTAVGDTLVFDKMKFQEFIANKAFLPDSCLAALFLFSAHPE